PGRSTANVHFRPKSRCLFVLFGKHMAELFNAIPADEAHGATPEPAAGHAGTEDAVKHGSNLDHDVQFTAAHFVIVAEAAMGFIHETAEFPETRAFQSERGRLNAGIFGYYMAGSAVDVFAEIDSFFLEIGQRDVAKGTAERACGRFAFGAASVVFSG